MTTGARYSEKVEHRTNPPILTSTSVQQVKHPINLELGELMKNMPFQIYR